MDGKEAIQKWNTMKCEEIQNINAERRFQFSVDLNDQLKACRGRSRANKEKKKEAWMKQELVFGKGFLVKSHEGNGTVPIPIPVGLVL